MKAQSPEPTTAQPRDERWEFVLAFKKTDPTAVLSFDSKADIRKAFERSTSLRTAFSSETRAVHTSMLYRSYTRTPADDESAKGPWIPIPDAFFAELGLRKEALVRAEAKVRWSAGIAAALIVLGFVAVGSWLWLASGVRGPKTAGAWGALFWSVVGVMAGSLFMFRMHRLLGIITLIGGLVYLMRLFTSLAR